MTTSAAKVLPRSSWSTLRLLRSMRTSVLILDLMLLVFVSYAVSEHRRAVRELGEHAAPTIIAAQHVTFALEAMQDTTANELLRGPASLTEQGSAYEERRSEAVRAMMQAGQNDSKNDDERYLETLELGLGTYQRIAGSSHDLAARGDPRAMGAYDQAEAFMDGTLLPAAKTLQDLEEHHLREFYHAAIVHSLAARSLLITGCALQLLALAIAQVYLSRRTQRTFNLALLGASVLTFLLGTHLQSELATSHQRLALARETKLTSVIDLWRIRQVACTVDRDQGRLLLDTAHRSANELAFDADAEVLVSLPARLTPEELLGALRERHTVNDFSGLLASELSRTDLSDEREALLGALADWQQYLVRSGEIRHLLRAGQHEKAVQLSRGSNGAQASGSYIHFDQQVDSALKGNQGSFEAAVSQGVSTVGYAELEAVAITGAIAVLIVFGFAPRIREYL